MWWRGITRSPANRRILAMADVHLLGHVRLRVVDHRDAGVGLRRHAEPVVGVPLRQVGGDGRVGDGDVEEAGS
jgi:hypothetical protein